MRFNLHSAARGHNRVMRLVRSGRGLDAENERLGRLADKRVPKDAPWWARPSAYLHPTKGVRPIAAIRLRAQRAMAELYPELHRRNLRSI